MTNDNTIESVEWRPIRPGEDVREYHRTVELPFKIASMVDTVFRLPGNAERRRFMHDLAKVQSRETVEYIRRAVYQRLRAAEVRAALRPPTR